MFKGRTKLIGLVAGPALLLTASPGAAATQAEQAAFEAAIGEAKSTMMADSATALERAREAADLVKGDSKEAQKARLTSQWLEGEADLTHRHRLP